MLNTMLLQANAQGNPWGTVVMMVVIVAVFYFFMIRPQQKKQKALEAKRNALAKGDRVLTSGGIYGTIKEVKDGAFLIEVADGVRVLVDRGSVYTVETENK